MPGKMTPEIHLLLAGCGFPNLQFRSRNDMRKRERDRSRLHLLKAAMETTEVQKQWRRNLAVKHIKRADGWSAKELL